MNDQTIQWRLEALEKALDKDRLLYSETLKEKDKELDQVKKEVRELSDALRLAKIVARAFGVVIIGGALFLDQLQMWINRILGK